jgi:hypothetical protein
MYSGVYPELDSVMSQFVAGVRTALAENFVGAYLVGSLATGDFDLDSDVDFLIVTRAELSEPELAALRTTHMAIHALGNYPARHLEGSYIGIDSLNRADGVGTEPLWYVDNGSTSLERSTHDNQWHVRWILREWSIAVAGPEAKAFVRAVPVEVLRSEAAHAIRKLRDLVDAAAGQPLGWYNTRFGQSFAVLTCCRMLHTCKTGVVQSKLSGAKWAEQSLDPSWTGLIRAAWAERIGVRFGEKVRQPAEPSVVRETARFLAYAQKIEVDLVSGELSGESVR